MKQIFLFFLPSNQYQIDDRNESNIVSEEKYIEMVNNDKIVTISPYIIQEGKIKNNLINNERSKKNNDLKIIFNKNGNPVYNDIEFFECQSQQSSEMEKSNLNIENGDIQLLKYKEELNQLENIKNINTVFEMGEENTNICKCSSCAIF